MMERTALMEAALNRQFALAPTAGQSRFFHAFSRFLYSSRDQCTLMLRGYAGTGKTSCVSAAVKCLRNAGMSSVLLAPTGRAAKVFAGYSREPAWTIHREIYLRTPGKNGGAFFELKQNRHTDTVFFIDEVSMIGADAHISEQGDIVAGSLLEDLVSYVFSGSGCRLVLIGDDAQLPPVGSTQSPALDEALLQREFHLTLAVIQLTEVVRQKEDSGILSNATALRDLIRTGTAELPSFTLPAAGVTRLNEDVQPWIEDAYRRWGKDDTVIITRSNKSANLYNQQIRFRILGYEEEISSGDRMMVLKNNYHWLDEQALAVAGFIANGDTLEIRRMRRFEDRGPFRFCHATVALADYPDLPPFDTILLVNTVMDEAPSLGFARQRELANLIAEDYMDLGSRPKIRKAVMEDPYYQALQVKFAYAITCHKAQGGQWPAVFVDQGYIKDEMAGVELNRWLYTAITRATEHVFLTGFDERFFHRSVHE